MSCPRAEIWLFWPYFGPELKFGYFGHISVIFRLRGNYSKIASIIPNLSP